MDNLIIPTPCSRQIHPVDQCTVRASNLQQVWAYVEALCGLPAATIEGWRGAYRVDAAAECWARAVLPADFRYQRRACDYWDVEVRLERRAQSVLGRFVPYHLRCAFTLREHARDRLFVRLPQTYANLAMPHGFKIELEPIFSYKSGALIDDPTSGLWTVAYTERVVRICSGLLFDVYDTFRLWWVPPDVIAFARQLEHGMVTALGSESNVCELLELLSVVEATAFDEMPEGWRDRITFNPNRRVDHHSGRRSATTDRGADFIYYDPWQRVKISKSTAESRAAVARVVPDDLPLGWDHVEDDYPVAPRNAGLDYDPRVSEPATTYAPAAGQPQHGGGYAAYTPYNESYGYGYGSGYSVYNSGGGPLAYGQAGPSSAAADYPLGTGSGVAAAEPSSSEGSSVRRFLEEAGVVSRTEPAMSWNEMKMFVRGRMR